jgi:hypothetical protein
VAFTLVITIAAIIVLLTMSCVYPISTAARTRVIDATTARTAPTAIVTSFCLSNQSMARRNKSLIGRALPKRYLSNTTSARELWRAEHSSVISIAPRPKPEQVDLANHWLRKASSSNEHVQPIDFRLFKK